MKHMCLMMLGMMVCAPVCAQSGPYSSAHYDLPSSTGVDISQPHHEGMLGLSHTPSEHLAPTLWVQYVRPWRRDGWNTVWSAGVIGARHRGDHTQLLGGGGVRRQWDNGWYVEEMLLINSEDTAVLSGHGQWSTSLGWQHQKHGVVVRHISNGSTQGANRGETMLLYSYNF